MDVYYFNKTFSKRRMTDGHGLVYDAIEKKWKFINSYHTSTDLRDLNEKKWVRIKKWEGAYIQDGPHSDADIFFMLQNSQMSFQDRIWKKGLKKWTAISETLEFSDLFNKKTSNNQAQETADLLDSVIEMRRVENRVEVPKLMIEPEVNKEKNHNPVPIPTDKKSALSLNAKKSDYTLILSTSRESRILEKILFALGVTLVFLFIYLKLFV